MKHRQKLCGAVGCLLILTSCGLMPAEEELPSAPIAREVEEVQYEMTSVQRGDLELQETVRLSYRPAKSESLSFRIGGEYIEAIYVEPGDSVQAGDLIAELAMGDLEEQLRTENDRLETLRMQKSHLTQKKNLAVRRSSLQIQQIQNQINGLTAAPASGADPADPASSGESTPSSDSPQQEPSGSSPEDPSAGSSDSASEGPSQEPSESSTESLPESVPTDSPESPSESPSDSTSDVPSDSSQQEGENPEEEEPAEPAPSREQLQQMLSESNQNLKTVQSQFDRQIAAVDDSIYIQQKRIEEIKDKVTERRIYATIDGSVTYVRKYNEGAVSVEKETVAVIADVDSSVFLSHGKEAADLHVGDEVGIEYKKEVHEAVVVDGASLGLEEAEEEESDEPVAYVQLLQPDLELEEGTNGIIHVVLERKEDVLYVKASTIKQLEGQPVVYCLDENGLKIMKEVETGLNNGEYVEILSGLTEGEAVIDE